MESLFEWLQPKDGKKLAEAMDGRPEKRDSIHQGGELRTFEEEPKALVFEYIEVWCNKKRKDSSLGYCSPVGYKEINKIVR